MPQKTNLNVAPYNDDFDPAKEFYRVLFRSGYSIQARELTSLQSILQNQIESVGKFQFKQGQQVIPGEVGLNTRLDYVKLSSVSEVAVNVDGEVIFQKYDIKQLVGSQLRGLNSGVVANVIETDYATTKQADTLFVQYLGSGDENNESTFRQGETLEVVGGVNTPLLVVGVDGSALPTSIDVIDPVTETILSLQSPAMGFASAVDVEQGVYFVNGFFVRNEKQTVIVDNYYDKPSAKVGFNIIEEIVAPEQDSSLYDNARGYSNASAPGAHRLKISLDLVRYDYLATTDNNFIRLLQVNKGVIEKEVKPADYTLLEETLARRTYDESGDYVVDNFSLGMREYYQKDGNNGVYRLNTDTDLVNEFSEDEAEAKMVLSVGPGKAYVKGFEIVNNETKEITVDKARDSITRNNITIKTQGLAGYNVTNVYGSVPLNTVGDEFNSYPTIYLHSVFNDGTLGENTNEPENYFKSTVERRSKSWGLDVGIKTIYVEIAGNFPTLNEIPDVLWFVKTFDGANVTSTDFVEVIGKSIVRRPEVSTSENQFYLELTVVGNRALIDTKFLEYGEDQVGNRRFLYTDEASTIGKSISSTGFNYTATATGSAFGPEVVDAEGGSGSGAQFNVERDVDGNVITFTLASGGNGYNINDTLTIPGDTVGGNTPDDDINIIVLNNTGTSWGYIVDYNDTITPVVGLAKPKNFNFIDSGVGFNRDTDLILSKGRNPDGQTPYSSTFGLSYFNPVFLTKIKLDSPVLSGFGTGKYITGRTSKAYGVIENDLGGNYSYGETIFVNTSFGQFLPGETIVDEDGNTLRIAQENTISHFVVTFGGTGYPNTARVVVNGEAFDNSIIDFQTFGGRAYKAKIIDRTRFNKTYAVPPLVTVTDGPTEPTNQARITAVLNTNTVQTYRPDNIKSFYSEYNNYKFTADVNLSDTKYSSFTQVSDFPFNGFLGSKYLECNGFGVDLAKYLVKGDIVQFTDDENNVVKIPVQQVTQPSGSNKSRIYLEFALPNKVTNASVIRIRPVINNSSKSTLIFPTGSQQVGSLVDSDSDSKFKYFARKDFVTEIAAGGGFLTFSAQLTVGTQRFTTFNSENYILTVLDRGDSTVVENGDILYIDPESVSINQSVVSANTITAGSLIISLPGNYFGNGLSTYPKLKLTATVEVDRARPRLKTAVKNKRIIIVSSGDKVIPLRGQDYDSETLQTLTYSDAYKLRYVYEGTSTTPPSVDSSGTLVSGTDVTYKFAFDSGQRDTLYDVSRIVLQPGFDAPTGQLVVAFDYFDHSQGDFCTVDSYLHEAGVPSEEIPQFNSSVYGQINLRDVIDFRPKVDSETTITGFQDVSILANPEGKDYINFNSDGGIKSLTPAPDKQLEYTAIFSETQYLDRIDGVFLTKKGDFIVKKGNSSLNPSKPEPVDDAVALAYLSIPAYTNSTKDVRISSVDNRRYTMRDIGKIEKRVERLEYYTALSILEQQALNMQVRDSIGVDRFKSGFFVDNFEAHGVGNLTSPDYKCSIDTQQSVLRPSTKEDSILLKELNTRNDERNISGYVINNGVVTLPYTSQVLLGNSNATTTINPNPFVVLQYVGDGFLSPSVDQWYDSTIAPLVVDSNTKLNSIFLAKDNIAEAFSGIFNNYIINWVGSNQSIFSIESLSSVNSEDISSTVSIAKVASSSNVSPQNNELAKGVASKSVNGSSVSTALQFFLRTRPVKFTINRIKPNTKVYVFMEGRDIGRWTIPDSKYTSVPGNSPTTFGADLVTDDNGNLSGIILIPAGKSPLENSTWNGNLNDVSYDEFSEEVRFTEGTKTIRFTSSASNAKKDEVETYAEVKYYGTGLLPQNPASIVSTDISFFKANEGTQLVDSNTDVKSKPNPLAQTFKIENFEGGVFTTGVDLYFAKKSATIPVRAYLTDLASGKPGKNIIPGTQIVKSPDTILRVYLTGDVDSITIERGEDVTGLSSGAVGPLSKVYDRNNVLVADENSPNFQINKNQVYTLVLNNNNGKSFVQNEALQLLSVTRYNDTRNRNASIVIAKDSGKVSDLKVESLGSNYTSATVIIESPQLPGGTTAVGSANVSNGELYNANLALGGNGYTEAPSVVIRGVGSGASGAVVKASITIDTPAVLMGVADDSTSITQGTIPTRFDFKYPVYLTNDTEYALVIETDSIDYELWASKLGDVEVTTGTVVTTQPLLGSVYKSQNTDVWTEDIFEDIKFTLLKAEFNTQKSAELLVVNENLGYTLIDSNPFETSVRSSTTATSNLFKNNNSIIKVNQRDHGFEDRGNSYVFYRSAEDVGGISGVSLNSLLYRVTNSGVDSYNITGPNRAGSNVIGGGSGVLATYNRKYEKLYAQVAFLELEGTTLESFVKTTNIIPVDSNTQNYLSYSVDDYERTFLNEEHFFLNQKVIASRVNELYNDVSNSLAYKFVLSSSNSNLSPVVNLNTASVKTVTNRIENATGFEDRFGKRNQVLTFLPLYNLGVSLVGDDTLLQLNYTVEGNSSGATATIVSYADNIILVKLRTATQFIEGESLTLRNESSTVQVGVSLTIASITEETFEFTENANLIAYYPQNLSIDYDNKINGNTILWDSKLKELVVENPYLPINSDYNSAITLGSAFARNLDPDLQPFDIFRVGDVVKTTDNKYVEISKMEFTVGVDYVAETDFRNSSSIAKYTSKEVAINSPGTSIDVRLTANVLDSENIKVFYKVKKTSDQLDLDNVNWQAFNIDGNPDNDDLATASNSISALYEKQESYQEFKYSVADVDEFSSFAIKIVMKTDNPAYPPKIQDLRAVATY